MDWVAHNLVLQGDVVRVAAWQKYEWLKQGFSLRSAGNVGQRFGRVVANRQKVIQQLGFNGAEWVGMYQIHGSRIQVVEMGSDFPDTDGMITDKKKILLAVVVADCVPILVVDPVKRIVGVAHAGRRGTESGIAKMIVNELVNNKSNIQDLQVALGPSIGPCCYEINRETHDHFDLWSTNEQQLREAGVTTIIRTDLCTKEHPELFFSHRVDDQPGRFAGVIGIA